MASRDALRTMKGSGFLVKDPTDLTAASPYGGTILGTTGMHDFRPGFKFRQIVAEEWGTAAEVVFLGQAPAFGAVLRSWDDDAMATVHPLTATGSSSGRKVVSHDVNAAATRAGIKLSANAHKLLFVPESVRTQHAVYLPNAVAVVDGDAVLQFRRDVVGALGCLWIGLPDSNGKTHEKALLEDITL